MNKNKIVKKFIRTLSKAEQFAMESRDIEALMAISDRWYALLHEDDSDESHRIAMGFINQEMRNDSSKARD